MLKQFKENHPYISAFAEGCAIGFFGTLGAALVASTVVIALVNTSEDEEE